jgi:hypothetical protein
VSVWTAPPPAASASHLETRRDLQHRAVACRSSAIVLAREGCPDQAEALRRRADQLDADFDRLDHRTRPPSPDRQPPATADTP